MINYRLAQIAVHAQHEAGRFSTQDMHIASEKRSGVERGAVYLLHRARMIGEHADVADDQKFVDAIGARVVRLPGEILPVGPFHLPEYSPDAIRLASEEKREVYTQLFRNLGPKQQGRLAEAIHASYSELRKDATPAPDFDYVREKLDEIYEHEDLQPDSLTELLRQLTVYRLFWAA